MVFKSINVIVQKFGRDVQVYENKRAGGLC